MSFRVLGGDFGQLATTQTKLRRKGLRRFLRGVNLRPSVVMYDGLRTLFDKSKLRLEQELLLLGRADVGAICTVLLLKSGQRVNIGLQLLRQFAQILQFISLDLLFLSLQFRLCPPQLLFEKVRRSHRLPCPQFQALIDEGGGKLGCREHGQLRVAICKGDGKNVGVTRVA